MSWKRKSLQFLYLFKIVYLFFGKAFKKILKKNKNYQNLGILNISISNFKAEILCLETKKMIKVNRPYYFMNATELKSKFISSFLKKILKKIKFIK